MKQGENTTNEDFLKQAIKEIKVYEKHGANFCGGLRRMSIQTEIGRG